MMKTLLLNRLPSITSAGLLILLSACNGGGSGDSNGGGVITANDFSFPSVSEANGQATIATPEGALPSFSARRTLQSGSGSTVEFNDPVVLKYEMFSWSTGELVESSDSFGEPMTVKAGSNNGVPEYLSQSLLGRKIGDKIQIVFEAGMEDLPSYLDPNDAYVLVVDII